MKFKHLFFAAAAAILAFAACEPEEKIGVPDIQVTPSTVSFQSGASTQTVSLTASRDWTVSGAPEWLAFDPSSGEASASSQTVTITAMANSGYDRSADVTFTIGLMKAFVHVDQPGEKGKFDTGDGSKEHPFSASAAYEHTLTLPSDGEDGPFYIKGIVSSVSTTYEASGTYGNATFYLSDDGSTTGSQFYVYQTYYLGNRKWKSGDEDVKVGDEVIVYGKVVNYKGNTPETVGKGASYVYSLNGKTGDGPTPSEGEAKGSGTLDDPYNPAGAAAYAGSLDADVQSPGSIYIKGTISDVATTFADSGTYGNATFTIVDSEDGTGSFYVYQTYYLGNRKWVSGDTDVKVGDEVIVYGPVVNYKGNTPETVGKGASYIYSLNGETGDDVTPTDYANAPAKTVAEFIAAADKSTYYKLSGTIGGAINTQYGNFDLTDDTGTIYVYGTDNISEYASKLVSGAKVTLAAKYDYYEKNQKHEAVNAYILSIEGGDTPGETTEVKKVTVAEFLAAPESSTQWYEITGTVSNIRSGNGEKYGNFDLTDATGTVYVYGLTSKKVDKNDQSFASLGIKAGDEITIITLRASFNGEPQAGGTPPAYLKGGSDTPGGGETSDIKAVTIAEFLAAPESSTQWYEITGTVSNIRSGNGEKYGNFDLTDATGTVYVYGLTSKKVDKNDQSFASLGIKAGDEITIITLRASFNGEPQAGGTPPAYLKGGSDTPGGGGGGETTGDFASNVSWTSGADASYNEKANVNGTSDVAILKLGTSSKTGKSTLTLPEGSTSLTLYALSWKGKPSKVVFTVNGTEVGSIEPAANDGLANTSPYTLTVTDSDKYTVSFPATSTVQVETSGTNTRAALFGIQAK